MRAHVVLLAVLMASWETNSSEISPELLAFVQKMNTPAPSYTIQKVNYPVDVNLALSIISKSYAATSTTDAPAPPAPAPTDQTDAPAPPAPAPTDQTDAPAPPAPAPTDQTGPDSRALSPDALEPPAEASPTPLATAPTTAPPTGPPTDPPTTPAAPEAGEGVAQPDAADCPCAPPFALYGELCLHLVPDGGNLAVKVACRSLGGELVDVTSEERDALVRTFLARHWRSEAWLGAEDVGFPESEDWRWPDGNSVSFAGWADAAGSGSCAVISLYSGWRRKDCALPAPGVCVRPAEGGRACEQPPPSLGWRVQGLLGLPRGRARPQAPLPPPPPPPPAGRPPLDPTPPEMSRLELMDAPVAWHEWL